MNQRSILMIMVFVFFISSVVSTIVLTWKVNEVILSGETVGNISLSISNPCGNDICGADEICVADASFCDDNICFEPACNVGCGQTAVASGGTDEACFGNTGCTGSDCQCDGAGNCISGGAQAPAPGGGTGGPSGGGGTAIGPQGIDVLEDRVKSSVKVNEVLKQRITIINLGTEVVPVTIKLLGVEDLVRVLEPDFNLKSKETKIVPLEIFYDSPGVYSGQIIVTSPTQTISVPIVIEVETKEVLFDLSLDVKPKVVLPGEEISAFATLFNVNEIDLANVNINYLIKNLENELILEDSEIITIETQATISKTFVIPENTPFGEYVFIVQASYQKTVGTASESFTVGRLEQPITFNQVLLIIIAFWVAILIFISLKTQKRVTKTISNLKKQRKRTIKSLKSKTILDRVYEEGYISERTYRIGKSLTKNSRR